MLPDKTSAAVAKYTVAGRRERHKPASWIVKPGIDWFISIHPTPTSLYAIWWRTLRGLCQIVIERLLWSIILNFRLQQHNSMSILFDSSAVTFFSSKPVDTQRSGILDLVRIRIKVPIWSGKSPDFGLQDPEKENLNLFRPLFSYFEG